MTEYAKAIAEEYGLEYVSEDGDHFFQLDGANIIYLYKSHRQGAWMWELLPLGHKKSPRQADGQAPEFDDALMDAEGMLRHYLRTAYTQDEIDAVWPADVLERVRLRR
jgi:hypothetical protein